MTKKKTTARKPARKSTAVKSRAKPKTRKSNNTTRKAIGVKSTARTSASKTRKKVPAKKTVASSKKKVKR